MRFDRINRLATFALTGGMVTLAGCEPSQDPPGPGSSFASSEAPLVMDAAAPGIRWIGSYDPALDCPKKPNWADRRLIEDAAAPADLRKYCVYEWVGSGNPKPWTLPPKPTAGGPVSWENWLDQDFVVSGPQAPPAATVANIVRPTLLAAHKKQIEMPAPVAIAGPPVQIAIVDTWASTANRGRSFHGFTMAAIAEQVACGALDLNGPCPIQAVPRLGLKRWGPNHAVDETSGGFYGMQSELAEGIYDAVAQAPNGPLVIELAVGWDSRFNASTAFPGQASQAVLAVRAALGYAACSNAIVIAAAGNETGGPEPGEGPVMPAAWAQIPAPACAEPDRPLLWAVGGVNGRDKKLPNARPLGRPALAAPGFMVPATKLIGVEPVNTPFVTGTSPSATVVAAIAALVWHQDQSLTPKAVMDLVESSGVDLNEPADFCLNAPCGNIRRVSVCRALEAAGAAVDCSAVEIAAGEGTNPVFPQSVLAAVDAVPGNTASGLALKKPTFPPNPTDCSMPTMSLENPTVVLGPEQLCPSEVLPSDVLLPSIDPQPIQDPCPACFAVIALTRRDTVILEMTIDSSLPAGLVVTPLTFTFDQNNAEVGRTDIGSAVDLFTNVPLRSGMVAGQKYKVELRADLEYGRQWNGATIEWTSAMTADTFRPSHPLISGP